jgi:hypothetical protein
MAEVFGEIGGQPVVLRNAATEATLKQLVQAVGILAAKSGKDSKSQAEIEKELKKFHDQLSKSSKAVNKNSSDLEKEQKKRKALADQINKENSAREKAEKRTIAGINAVRGFTNALEGGVTKLTGVMSQLAGMGNSFSGAASAFGSIPLVGGMLSQVFGAVAQSADKVFTSFKQSSSVGANFNGSIRDLVNAASGAGLTMDQFSAIIQKNGENLAFLGGSSTEGAKQLAAAAKSIRKSQIGDDLARLGYSTEDISNGMARFGGMMAKSGKQMNQEQLVKHTGEYLKQLDAVARLTGKNKDALQAEADARMADAQYRLMLAKLDPEGAANLETLMASIPKEHQAGLKEIMATGTAVSDEAVAAMAFMNKTGQNAQFLGESMRQSGTLTKEQMFAFDTARRTEMKMLADEARTRGGTINTIGNFGDAVQQKLVVGVLDAAAQTQDLRTTVATQTRELSNSAKAQKDAMDPAQMQQFQQTIAETSNKMSVLLAENLPKLVSSFDRLMQIIDDYVVPAFRFLMDNFSLVVGTIVAFKGALVLAAAAAKAFELYKAIAGPGTSPMKPMYVVDISGPGGAGGKGKGKGKGGSGRMGGLARGGIGAIAGLGMGMAADYATDQGYERTGAGLDIGSSALTYGGTGAMIGSVIPGIGTAVGAGVGAVIGTGVGLYRNWGKFFGGGKEPAGTPATPKFNEKEAKEWAYSVYTGKATYEQVPNHYKEHVLKLLNNPPKEWGTPPVKVEPAKGTSPTAKPETPATTPATAKTEPEKLANANDSLALAKEMYEQANPKAGKPPTSIEISTPKPENPVTRAETDRKNLENKPPASDTAPANSSTTNPNASNTDTSNTSPKPNTQPTKPATQESAETLLAQLNSKMDQLIKINKDVHSVNERQLTVQQSMTGDLYVSV